MSKGKILFQLSGSIAAYKACNTISQLSQEGYEVQTLATANALRFVGPATLEGLSGRAVFTDAYEAGRMLDHIHLAKWADLAILCPATANSINKLATGIADDALTTLFLAYELKKPYLIAPAMNQEMFRHPATQSAMVKLKEWGVRILGTEHGHQACGDVGPGRLLEPTRIYEEILEALK